MTLGKDRLFPIALLRIRPLPGIQRGPYTTADKQCCPFKGRRLQETCKGEMAIAPKGKTKGKERGNKKKETRIKLCVLCRCVILLFGCFYSAITTGDT